MEILPKKGGIIVQRWDRRSCRVKPFFQVWGKKACHRVSHHELSCLGGLLCMFLEIWMCITRTFGALAHCWWILTDIDWPWSVTGACLLNFTSTPLPSDYRIREPYQNLHVFREVFPKRKPYITKKIYKHTYIIYIYIYIYTHYKLYTDVIYIYIYYIYTYT